jgi:hypothetical protein
MNHPTRRGESSDEEDEEDDEDLLTFSDILQRIKENNYLVTI